MNGLPAITSPSVAEVLEALAAPYGEVLAEVLGSLSEEFPGSVRPEVLHAAWWTLAASYPLGGGNDAPCWCGCQAVAR